jgi:hypothetical protein
MKHNCLTLNRDIIIVTDDGERQAGAAQLTVTAASVGVTTTMNSDDRHKPAERGSIGQPARDYPEALPEQEIRAREVRRKMEYLRNLRRPWQPKHQIAERSADKS